MMLVGILTFTNLPIQAQTKKQQTKVTKVQQNDYRNIAVYDLAHFEKYYTKKYFLDAYGNNTLYIISKITNSKAPYCENDMLDMHNFVIEDGDSQDELQDYFNEINDDMLYVNLQNNVNILKALADGNLKRFENYLNYNSKHFNAITQWEVDTHTRIKELTYFLQDFLDEEELDEDDLVFSEVKLYRLR